MQNLKDTAQRVCDFMQSMRDGQPRFVDQYGRDVTYDYTQWPEAFHKALNELTGALENA